MKRRYVSNGRLKDVNSPLQLLISINGTEHGR